MLGQTQCCNKRGQYHEFDPHRNGSHSIHLGFMEMCSDVFNIAFVCHYTHVLLRLELFIMAESINFGLLEASRMRAVLTTMVCLALVVGEASAQMTQAVRDTVLTEHNRLRRNAIGPGGPDVVSATTATAMLEMEYDMKLECVAQAYIETQSSGSFSHNADRSLDYAACGGSGYVGENWYSGSPLTTDFVGGATRAWVDFVWPESWGFNDCSERENYHGDRGCSGTVGHYTQVLWANSYKVGCGYTEAGGTVCNYSPGGNFVGQDSFDVGAACSACPETHSFCNNGLCSTTDTSSCDPLFEVCSPDCKVMTVSDVVTASPDATYEACEILVLGPDFIAADGSNISVSSGWEIDLMPGFIVEQGATLNANVCGQSLCMTSPDPMPYGCHSCVDQICDIDLTCCALEFDQACLDMVDTVCGLVCE
jgi:hypothetical protein